MTARETTLNGQSILSIPAGTPNGADLELRTERRRQINVSLSRNNQVDVYVNSVHSAQVMVGRINGDLHCLFIGPACIDITPSAALYINAWLAERLKAISA